jgi:hypothetical protein
MSTRASDHGEMPWHPPGSLQRHGLRWLYLPLIAFAIFTVGPSVLAPIGFILSLVVDLRAFIGPHAPNPFALLLDPLVLAIAFWPFLALYGITRNKLIAEPAEWRSIRLATIGATIAMSLPSTIFLVGVPQEMTATSTGAGQGTGIACFLFMIFLPLPGIFGWLTGRGIAWVMRL